MIGRKYDSRLDANGGSIWTRISETDFQHDASGRIVKDFGLDEEGCPIGFIPLDTGPRYFILYSIEDMYLVSEGNYIKWVRPDTDTCWHSGFSFRAMALLIGEGAAQETDLEDAIEWCEDDEDECPDCCGDCMCGYEENLYLGEEVGLDDYNEDECEPKFYFNKLRTDSFLTRMDDKVYIVFYNGEIHLLRFSGSWIDERLALGTVEEISYEVAMVNMAFIRTRGYEDDV